MCWKENFEKKNKLEKIFFLICFVKKHSKSFEKKNPIIVKTPYHCNRPYRRFFVPFGRLTKPRVGPLGGGTKRQSVGGLRYSHVVSTIWQPPPPRTATFLFKIPQWRLFLGEGRTSGLKSWIFYFGRRKKVWGKKSSTASVICGHNFKISVFLGKFGNFYFLNAILGKIGPRTIKNCAIFKGIFSRQN